MCKKIALPMVFILLLLMVAPAWASENTAAPAGPAATTQAPSTALPTAPPEPLFLTRPTGCICQCTCPSSGSFVSQCVVTTGTCGSLNGIGCDPGLSTCDVVDILQNCVEPVLTAEPCP